MEEVVRIVDTETTGLYDTARLVEVAAVDWRPGGSALHYASLINPGVPIPAEASAVHHICDADVQNAPSREHAIQHLQGVKIYAAHNMDFDKKMLPELAEAYWVCTRKVALRVVEDAPSYSLQVLRYHLNLGGPPANVETMPHRAVYDAWICERLFSWLKEHMSVKDMILTSREPALLRRIPFGQHRNKAFTDIDDGWLQWAVDRCEDEEVRYTAQREIARRSGAQS